MGLVDYSDSDREEQQEISPPAKKRKVSQGGEAQLPPLPASFLDQYSSTVRTSTQDDPSLHGGKKRVTPHIEGNWPTHVYLEWYPNDQEQRLITGLVNRASGNRHKQAAKGAVTSLVQNDLGVPLPLHISLSRPLVLRTEQKDDFVAQFQGLVQESGTKILALRPRDLYWHPNETKSRWFLVIRMQSSSDLETLLEICNGLAKAFKQPLLYAGNGAPTGEEFHISIAWSLQAPHIEDQHGSTYSGAASRSKVQQKLDDKLSFMDVKFNEVKVRVGQDVHVVALRPRR